LADFLFGLAVIALFSSPSQVSAQKIATVIQVTGSAQLFMDGRTFTFGNGARIENGRPLRRLATARLS
jgi:hypothetical protein